MLLVERIVIIDERRHKKIEGNNGKYNCKREAYDQPPIKHEPIFGTYALQKYTDISAKERYSHGKNAF